MEIRVEHLVKEYGKARALDDVSLTIRDGELFFLLGPSGCGKTTLLRAIGGFEQPTSGQIYLGGRDAAGTAPNERNTAMVFQGYALWPHLTVRQNVGFGLEMQGLPKAQRDARVDRVLKEIQISEYAQRKPNQLSGGQQQRVALARTLVVQPGCLLLDEPLANLDAKLRRDMRLEIRRICKDNHLTGIYVTHDRAEALSMADRIAVMRDGCLVQVGSPREVYRRPVNAFVANFIGETNLRRGRVSGRDGTGVVRIQTACGNFQSTACPEGVAPGQEVQLSMRPEAFRRTVRASGDNILEVAMAHLDYLGEIADYIGTTADGETLKYFELNPKRGFAAGDRVCLEIDPEDVVVLTV